MRYINKIDIDIDRLQDTQSQFSKYADPFSFDVKDAPVVLQMELIDLQCNSELKAKFREVCGK
jgi:hypothetical protein